MSFNLMRNARMFYTTNVDSNTGVVNAGGFTAANTREIQILDGMSFSQKTTSETINLAEAGIAPVRGQRSYNTALDPVDFSFSTYIRPAGDGTNITAEESVLWNSLMTGKTSGTDAWSEDTTAATLVATYSQAHQLKAFGLVIVVDTVTYIVDNCALDTAVIDFGLDAIATIVWTGKGTKLRQVSGITASKTSPVTFSGFTGLSNEAKAKDTSAAYIANKLSVLSITKGIGATGTAYSVALTGGSLTISNNITYLTPANLGIVNQPITYFTGTRAISGTINAYLRAGSTNSAGLLANMLASSSSDVNPDFSITLSIGGSTNPIRVEIELPASVLTIPSVDTQKVISTAINFTAQGSTGSAFDVTQSNEAEIRYYAVNA